MSYFPKYDSATHLAKNTDRVAAEIRTRVEHLERVEAFVAAKVTPLLAAQAVFLQLAEEKASVEQLRGALVEYCTRRDAFLNERELGNSLVHLKLPVPDVTTYADRFHEFDAIVKERTAETQDAADPTGKARFEITVAAFKTKMPTSGPDDSDAVLGARLAHFGYSALPSLYHRAKAIFATLAGNCSLKMAGHRVKELLKNPRRRKGQGYYGFATPATIRPLSQGGSNESTVVTAEDAALVLLLVCRRLLPPSSA